MKVNLTVYVLLFTVIGFVVPLLAAEGGDELFLNYDNLKTFKAEFNQHFINKTTKKEAEPETGTLFYEAPAFMRFDYKNKAGLDKQVVITDAEIKIINHQKKSAIKQKGQGEYGEYLVFLKGVAEIKKKFTVKKAEFAAVQKAGIKVLTGQDIFKLTPIKKITNLRYLFLMVKDKEVKSVAVIDELGNINQVIFNSLTNNPKIEKGTFTVEIPKGFDVSTF